MKTLEKPYIKLWIGNLGKYNEGFLIGEWFDLPVDMSEVAEVIGLNEQYEEWHICDFETNVHGLEIERYDDVEKLNEFAERLEQLDEHESLILKAYIQEYGSSNLLEIFDGSTFEDVYVYHDVDNMEDVAYRYYEDTGYLTELEKHINVNYIDFEAIGRDMSFDGTFVFLDNCCVQFLH